MERGEPRSVKRSYKPTNNRTPYTMYAPSFREAMRNRNTSRARQSSYNPRAVQAMKPQANFVDLAQAVYPCNTTGSITLLNTIPTGTSVNSRVGKRVMLKHLQMRGIVTSDTTTIVSEWGWMIIYDRRPTVGSLPAITDILDTVSPDSFMNDSNSSRFTIVRRSTGVNIGNTGGNLTEVTAENVEELIKFSRKTSQVTYRIGILGNINEIDEGALYLVTFGGTAAGTADSNLVVGFRLRFYDSPG